MRHFVGKTNRINEKRMNNFTFQNPVKLIFGKGSIAKLAKEIPADKKIMV